MRLPLSPRRAVLLTALLAIQAALAVTLFTPSPHPGGDNTGYVALGNALASGEGYVETWDPGRPAHTKYPPVFPFLIALLIKLGVTTWAGLKVIPLASSVVVTGMTFLWASRRVGDGTGAGIALLTGLSWSLLLHAGWILTDVPFLAFTLISIWAIEAATSAEGEHPPTWFVGIAAAAALLAYFTRSAGLPLVLAILGSLALRREWRMTGILAGVLGVPAAVWFVRGLTAGSDEGRYVSEFFLVDPYDPARGTAGVGDFATRVGENVIAYATRYLPETFVSEPAVWFTILILTLLIFAAIGWGRAAWTTRGPAELFVPLYTGLILLWPTVWSGDRFALPLLPLLLLYAAVGVRDVARTVKEGMEPYILALLLLLILMPEVRSWWQEREYVAGCNEAVVQSGPWACSGGATLAFATVAHWAGEQLDPEAVVISRKPRIFHALSGLPSRIYPFHDRPEALFREAGAAGARYLVYDGIGNTSLRYLAPALTAYPERFCQVMVAGAANSMEASFLFVILDDAEVQRREAGRSEPRRGPGVCDRETFDTGPIVAPPPRSEIPLLTRTGDE